MENKKFFIAIILFGSLWGFSEVILGSLLSDAGFASGGLMTGFFAIPLLVLSRMYFKKPGMQLGMGLVAGSLRLFNPFIGCQVCSAISIMAEGAVFELIWYAISTDFKGFRNLTTKSSAGIFSAYVIFVTGYIVTQILTPIVAGSGFYLNNLIVFMPRILAAGLIPALIASFTVPLVLSTYKLDISIKDRLYYPTSIGISLACWFIVLGTWFIFTA